MAFIRRVRTASGATAVQIAEYVGGRQRIVQARRFGAHRGRARGAAGSGRVSCCDDPAQGVLDLEVEPTPRGAAAGRAAGGAGAVRGSRQAPAPRWRRDGPGRVVGTDSRLLFEALAGVYTDLGFDALGDEVFRDLVIARVVEPTSLLDTGRVLTDLGRAPASYATMKRTLAPRAGAAATATRSRRRASTHAPHQRRRVAWCSTTSRRCTSRPRRRTTCARSATPRNAASTRRSWSDCWSTVTGSHSRSAASRATRPRPPRSSRSSRPFQARHGLADMVVVADAGMLSASNLRELDEAGPAVHRRLPGDQGPDRPGLATSAGTATRSPTGSSSTPSPPGTGRKSENNPTLQGRTGLGPRRSIPGRGGRCGRTRPSARSGTTRR